MRIRGKVRLLCPSCVKVKVQVTRDKGYVQIKCDKNPRHNQRTKWPSQQSSFSTSTQMRCPGMTLNHMQMQSSTVSSPLRALLAARSNACIGENCWRAMYMQRH
mmetsp:Transcript_27380/g.81140  ORF Transcript_27380/g.81140 Transcript_27380/m.81140 type:complete len:104 (-) Transcript_27380:4394-4705(-)